MTDKELFEKTEKVFNLNKKNPIIENVYKKGNFKQTLLEWRRSSTSPIRSNYGDNTVSAAKGLGRGATNAAQLAGQGIGTTARGVAKTAGAVGRGLGKFGKFLDRITPGTNTNRRNKAETRKQEAQARAEQLKNIQMQQQMMFGGGESKPGPGGKPGGGVIKDPLPPKSPAGNNSRENLSLYFNNWIKKLGTASNKDEQIKLTKELVNTVADRGDDNNSQAAISVLQRHGQNIDPNVRNAAMQRLKDRVYMEKSFFNWFESILAEHCITLSEIGFKTTLNESFKNHVILIPINKTSFVDIVKKYR